VQSVTYEDDLDLLVVSFIRPCPDDEGYMGQVSLHDNQTGAVLKTISLSENWDMVSCARFVCHIFYAVKTTKRKSFALNDVFTCIWQMYRIRKTEKHLNKYSA